MARTIGIPFVVSPKAKEKTMEMWRDQVHIREVFANGDNTLTICGIYRFVGNNPNAAPRCELEYFGTCEDPDGEVVNAMS
jgi:hypothetical protein